MEDTSHLAIAVVGVGAIMPDAPDAPSFWGNIKSGRYSISDVQKDRWDPELYFDADPKAPDKSYSKIGGWVRSAPWDPMAWKLAIPPRVVDAMDEGQRWALAATREALVDYGWPNRPLDLDRTAVIVGNAMAGEKHYRTALRISYPEYAAWLDAGRSFRELPPGVRRAILSELRELVGEALPPITEDTMPGELANCIAGRIANTFNTHGPNFTCDAACASALAALSAAREGLIEGDFDAVITGGIDRNMGAPTFVKFCKIGALSATGTRPFADGADGFVMGEGAALFVMKRLADAEKAGDRIYAVIRGMAGSSDGKGKGITAPNPVGQRFAIERAWKDAGLAPSEGMLIEAHGTSTKVGDVVEVNSLTEVFGRSFRPRSIALGSVKSNIGHLKGAAGAASLFKAVMSLHEKVLPPSLNFSRPNPNIEWESSPFVVNTELAGWKAPADGVRKAAVSAFGFGGTNFHIVLEEHQPGRLARRPQGRGIGEVGASRVPDTALASPARERSRGVLLVGAPDVAGLVRRVDAALADARGGKMPPFADPARAELDAAERIAIDHGSAEELIDKLEKARKALSSTRATAWKPLAPRGIFRGSGPAPKLAFLFTGQGSQYANMLRELWAREPVVRDVFAEADRVLTPKLGRTLTSYVFVDPNDADAVAAAEEALKQTAITQPAVLSVDVALARLMESYGIVPDMVMGHSLGEYGALVAARALPFADALEAVAARGKEMSSVSLDDNGKMAAVMGPIPEIERILAGVSGYVVIANFNSTAQVVIGGSSEGVDNAAAALSQAGYQVVPLQVSHAFHTSIVAPASAPLGRVLERLALVAPEIPVIANVTGAPYPTGPNARAEMLDLLARQVASPVRFVTGLEQLYADGARVFVELGPKRALHGFAEDVLGGRADVLTLSTNHPKLGDVTSMNHALAGLYARGIGPRRAEARAEVAPLTLPTRATAPVTMTLPVAPAAKADDGAFAELGRALVNVLERSGKVLGVAAGGQTEPVGITGAALGLPGTPRVFEPDAVARLLNGEQLIDVIPTKQRKAMLDKNITRLVKKEGSDPVFEPIASEADVIKLAGRAGAFDLGAEYGVPADRVGALDITTQLAFAAGIDALRDAGIPLVARYKRTTKGSELPDGWALPDSMRDDTGIVFASAFPGYDHLMGELDRYYADHARRERLAELRSLRARTSLADPNAKELDRRIGELEREIEQHAYAFDRRFLFQVLSMGHAQFAEYIRARGPNTQVNSACASTTQAVGIAEDWIRAGRCRRVIVIAADDITSDAMLGWFASGFLATGAAATDAQVEEAATPFDRRRHGMLIGMGAAALVLESAESSRERGVAPIAELLGSEIANSAFHGTRLDVEHITLVMESLVRRAEERWGVERARIASELVFVSHETYTPARGGSAAAEISALRKVFGAAAERIVIANTKGYTGHPMGAGIEDVLAVKSLETGVVPPVPNFKEVDPELGVLNLSRGGSYPVEYALRLGAGFGSQVSMTLLRRGSGGPRPSLHALGFENRIVDRAAFDAWLVRASGQATPELEVVRRTLRVKDAGHGATRAPLAPSPVVARSLPAPTLREPAPAPLPPAPRVDDVAERVLALVSEKTGYPRDMLALDLDLEADLGIDTVKQAEVFATIRAAYDIRRDDGVKLRDYPTLAHVIQFVKEKRPELGEAAPVTLPRGGPSPATLPGPSVSDDVAERVLALVSEKTGYPRDMLALDLDLEADLGIDTVKQAEVFASVRAEWEIPRDDSVKLRDYPTLGHVIEFVRTRRPELGAPGPAAPAPAAEAAPDGDEVTERILGIVAEKTGYPRDMLALDLDLEADLGIDTVKQAEVFASIRAAWDIPRDDSVKLRDYPTLAHVVRFVEERRVAPSLAVPTTPAAAREEPRAGGDAYPRRVVVPVLRPGFDVCKRTGVTLGKGTRVVVVADRGGVGEALAARLIGDGVEVFRVEPSLDAPALVAAVRRFGAVHGVYWLPALEIEPAFWTLEEAEWKALRRARVKNASHLLRELWAELEHGFFVAATRMGGQHGYDRAGALSALGGAVSGLAKAFARERPSALVKCVDFEREAQPTEVCDTLLAETLRDPGVVEVGHRGGLRFSVGFDLRPAGESGATLGPSDVVVVTGAAGSITSAITADLARASGASFWLLDLAPEPDAWNPDLARLASDREGLRRDLFERMKARGERATPAAVEKELASLERGAAALGAIRAVTSAGGRAEYRRVDLTDGAAVSRVIDQVRERHGKIDVLVHAAGLEISRSLPDKSPEEFDRVWDVKADGLYHLLHAIGETPLGRVIAFSSIAGRFGNAGQTDYASANDFSCKALSSFASLRPATRGTAIDWTAWAEIGMATRGSIPAVMAAAGIDMLPPDVGVPIVRRELGALDAVSEIVAGGRLGALMSERDESGGADLAALALRPMPMLGEVSCVGQYSGLVLEAALDPARQGFLNDHRIEGVPVLPGVMGLEAFAEAASVLLPGWSVRALENVDFLAPFKFYRDEPRRVHVEAVLIPDGDEIVARCRLSGTRALPGGDETKLHFSADVRLARSPLEAAPGAAPAPTAGTNVAADAIYRVYFHGPTYRVLAKAWRVADGAAAELAVNLPPNHQPADQPTLMAPRLIESCFQTAGIFELGTTGRMGLPEHIDRVTAFRQLDPENGERLYARATARNGGYDAEIVDAAGRLCVKLSGYRTAELPAPVDAALLEPLSRAMA